MDHRNTFGVIQPDSDEKYYFIEYSLIHYPIKAGGPANASKIILPKINFYKLV